MERPPYRRYEVLYYKRKHNKVHKSKGVAKLDGMLVIAPPPSCRVTLWRMAEPEPQPQPQPEPQPHTHPAVASGIHRQVSKRAFADDAPPLAVDDVVSLALYDCQIVGRSFVVTDTSSSNQQSNKNQHQQSNNKNLVVPSCSSLLGANNTRKRPLTSPATTTTTTTTTHKLRRVALCSRKSLPPPSKSHHQHQHQQLDKRQPLQPPRSRPVHPFGSDLYPTTTMVDLFPKARPGMVVPPSLTKALLPHQIQGITFLWNCLTKTDTKEDDSHGNGRGAILADQMGLGKSLMTVCVLFALHRRNPMHRFVVVCPSSLTTNWSNEFDKWIGKASQPKRVVVNKGGEHGLAKMRAFVPVKPHLSEVLIISYDLFRRNASLLTQAKQIGLLVLDEGHKLKNSAGSHTLTALQQLNTEARLLLTGTPIQNNLTEFYTVANFVCPGRLGNVASFRRDYERPIAAANSKAASVQQRRRGREQSKALDAITKTFMIRRLQKNLLKSTLPPRHEFLLFCRPSDVQCDLYRSLASRNTVGGMGPTAEALTVLTNLRKLCCHPSLVQEDGRGPLTSNDIASSGKLEILLALLEATKLYAPNDKVVIVSNFTSALSVMEETILKPRNWPYHRLDGSTVQADRQSAVDSFNRASAEKTFVFLLSSKAGGCGLNMVGANRLIMFDADFNPATDSQAMARIYRKGQTKSCFIYRLFSAGTIEEVVLQRQMHKGNLASATVDGSSSTKVNSRGFSKEELRDCFTLKENAACDTQRKLGKKWAAYGGPTDSHLVAIGDSPLVFVAESCSDKLTFVHVVEEQENSVNSSDDDDEDMDEFDLDDRSSSEEHEFEDEQSNSSTGSVGDDTSEEQEFNG